MVRFRNVAKNLHGPLTKASRTAASDMPAVVSSSHMANESQSNVAMPWLQGNSPAVDACVETGKNVNEAAGDARRRLRQTGHSQLGEMGQLTQTHKVQSKQCPAEHQEELLQMSARQRWASSVQVNKAAAEWSHLMLAATDRRGAFVPPSDGTAWAPWTSTSIVRKPAAPFPKVPIPDICVRDIPLPKWLCGGPPACSISQEPSLTGPSVYSQCSGGLVMKPPGLEDYEPSDAMVAEDCDPSADKVVDDWLFITVGDEEPLTQTESPYSSEAPCSSDASLPEQWDSQWPGVPYQFDDRWQYAAAYDLPRVQATSR